MKIFISWSGERSRIVAEFLRHWLPEVIQAAQPWMSAEDIDPGLRWGMEIVKELEASRFGIICLTPENLNTQWVLFEAGALAKTLESTFVCPFLVGLNATDLKSPLSQFQAVKADRDGTLNLIRSINKALGMPLSTEDRLRRAFDRCWPEFKTVIESLPPPPELPALSMVHHKGLESVFLTRGAALDEFTKYLKIETEKARSGSKARIWIVSSSLKGFLATTGRNFDGQAILDEVVKTGCGFRIMMTHPDVADLRAAQEGRSKGEIQTEIRAGVGILKNTGIDRDQIRFYRGTPTVFSVVTYQGMLLNPYPYERESHRCFSIIVRPTDESEGIYHQYLEYHFKKPWEHAYPIPPEEWDRDFPGNGENRSA